MDFSGFGSRSSYLDPDHIFALVIGRRPRDLLAYLVSIPGAFEDPNCRLVSLAGLALLDPGLRWFFPPLPDEDSWALFLAKYARIQAANSRLCAPQPVGNQFSFASDTGHYMHPLNSNSDSGRMLTVQEPALRHAAMLDHLSASSSRIPAATFPPLQANSNEMLRHAAMSNQLSASSSRIPAALFLPLQANSNDVIHCPINRAGTLYQSSVVNSGGHASAFPIQDNSTLALAFEELSLGQPGSEQMAPQELMQTTVSPQELEQNNHVLPTVVIKGKRPASEVDQLDAKIIRVNVASSMAQDGTNGGAGLLMRIGSSRAAQFISACCFRMPCADPVILFAAACAEGIKLAQAYQPTTTVVETHVSAAQFPWQEVEDLVEILKMKPPHWVFESISEESNHAARLLAIHGLMLRLPEMMIFSHPPEWLAPYVAGRQDQ